MSDSLFRYYETELFYIRKLAMEFAKKYPAAAARLQLEADRSADPHVERLVESFALLAARVRHKIDDEFPELTDALLGVVYPHALAPIPSMAVVQFELAAARGVPEGVAVPAHSPLHSTRLGDQYCKYRTTYPLRLWPIRVDQAVLHQSPFPPGLRPPPEADACLRLRLTATGELTFDKMTFDALRLHLLGPEALTTPLYDLLFNHAVQVAFIDPDNPPTVPDPDNPRAVVLPAGEVLRPVGFDPADAVLPFGDNVFPGYRLLTEYFAYQPKFLFADVGQRDPARGLDTWERVRRVVKPGRVVEVIVFLNRSHTQLEQRLKPDMFRLGCTPVVNLFEHTSEPIPLTHARFEYRLVPNVGQPLGHEVFSIQRVTAAGANGGDREYQPFFRFRHGADRHTATAFWYASRRASTAPDDRGTDVYMHFADTDFNPYTSPDDEAVVVRTLCTNRDLPTRIPRHADTVGMTAAFASPGATVKCVRNPTAPLRPPAPRGRHWHLVSHLNLNHLPLAADGRGLEALKGLLGLYDWTDPATDPHASALARQAIDGLVGVKGERAVAWVGGEMGGMVRGTKVTVELDESKFLAGSGVLFASVLERFFALTTSVNSFTQLVAKFRQRDDILKAWPPRTGDKPLV
jgi:type VI secretion system protein ImpG